MVTFKFRTSEDLKQAMHRGYVITPNKGEFIIIPSDIHLQEFEELIEVIEYHIKFLNNDTYYPFYFYLCPPEVNTEIIRGITRTLFPIDVKSLDEDSLYNLYTSIIGSSIFLIVQLEISKESPIYLLTEDIIQKILKNLQEVQDDVYPSLKFYYQDLLESLHNYDITKIDCYNIYNTLFENNNENL